MSRIIRPSSGIIAAGQKHGGGAYHAKAVHFDGATQLLNAGLVAADNQFYSSVVWFKSDPFDGTNNFPTIYQCDPEGAYTTGLSGQYSAGDFAISDVWADSAATNVFLLDIDPIPNGNWNCLIQTVDTLNGVGKAYLNDSAGPPVRNFFLPGSPFIMSNNGKIFTVGADTFARDYFVGDLADPRIMPGVSLLDGSNDISVATRRLFIDTFGKPVNPAIATASLGAPCILFSGDRTAFPVNQGTGGAFTLTGTLTDASSSPSD